MNQSPPGTVVALVTHARDVPAIQRAQFAIRVRHELDGRALVLETCHRVEAYWIDPVGSAHQAEAAWLPPGGRALAGQPAIGHAISVAVGRDSVVVGEDQVLHQLRQSVERARRAGQLDPALERLFAMALQAGRRARSWRQRPGRSLADIALAAIERRVGPLAGREILVVGAGRMGHLAADAAIAGGALLSVGNRSAERARTLAAATGGVLESFDPGDQVGRFAGVIVAIAGPWLVGDSTRAALRAAGTIVVDLSMPAAVDGALAGELAERAISADALALEEQAIAVPAAGWLARLDELTARTAAGYALWLGGRVNRATAEELIRRADVEREAQLARLWRHLPDLEPEARAAIDGMARHLARRLLREPLERLGRDSDGRDEQAVRDIFAL